MQVRSPAWEDPLEEDMATNSSFLVCRIPRTEQPGRIQPIGSQSQTRLKQLSTHVQGLVSQSCPTLCDPMDCSPFLCPWGFSRLESPCPPPGDLPNPGIEPVPPHCKQILCCLSHKGSMHVHP